MDTTTEQRTAALLLLLVAATVNGLRREYAKMISAKMGPRDNGYTATIDPLEDYLMDEFYGYWTRQNIRAKRKTAEFGYIGGR